MSITKRTSLLTFLAIALLLAATPLAAQTIVGKKYPTHIDGAIHYPGTEDGRAARVWQHEIFQPDASYIAIHFSGFQLAPGDELIITDASGGQSYSLTREGKMEAGTFWARHIKGDTARLELWATSPTGGAGFLIDEIVAGDRDLGGDTGIRAICGSDDKTNAVCYEGTYPTEYARSRPIVRLLISGQFLCTGWMVSADGKMITNEHCITSNTEAMNTDYELMAEAPNCNDSNCQLCHDGTIYAGGTLLRDNANLDYALVQVNGNPAAVYGFLEIDDRIATVGEQIYIPQHPAGFAKELGIFSSATSDATDGFCHVNSITSPACSGSGYNDVGYYCDTEGGSSGSPVLATSSHKVIALHHCANCPNRGVPIHLVLADIDDLLGPQCSIDADCDDGVFCNGTESCVAGLCKSGGDPCPGEDCDEGGDVCVPLICNNDGVCNTDEDCNNCGNDCISGSAGAAVCGDGACDTGAGEDCLTCATDCNGVTNGKPSNRYCCGRDIGCGDGRCTAGGNSCSTDSGSGTSYCCGDGICEGDEDSFNCAIDCGTPPACGDGMCDGASGETACSCSADCGSPPANETGMCTDGTDNDCDGSTDCADFDCAGDAACGGTCDPAGTSCGTDGDCCSNKCKGPSGRKTCK